ncbi:uncharacterized protein CELE_B0563.5 [Caenorhabditis elegans]|uniref:Uncharacterized protein B0563.5 n=1 Tax=Caenorhabditis elegans TaxID=6239 RepID=YT65_CAEEL|nr:Uncharacterized protein CELE_B0563.5 [Caenorhabditis elegans]Q11081.2 RecName: Full=Uncharacterized protein B0563.5 [Caenorhabditis elegans]CCD62252.1 Uncharacterized protein CELE_B0563.5 [Caenorhabditis elegans]|eukprot:NP_509542.2 Uncharacterized protein CELE_B0563.5 [Caenorhabditis elegans]
MTSTSVYFNDYYNRRASSSKLELCMSPSSSTISKSHSLDEIPDVSARRRHPSLGFLEFSKTANFRSRRDAVFEPLEFQRVLVTVTSAQIVESSQKRKPEESTIGMDAPKKMKRG